jgi:hypothetical protein
MPLHMRISAPSATGTSARHRQPSDVHLYVTIAEKLGSVLTYLLRSYPGGKFKHTLKCNI